MTLHRYDDFRDQSVDNYPIIVLCEDCAENLEKEGRISSPLETLPEDSGEYCEECGAEG
ncbi:MAG: hypothetical protein M3R38_33025 [Actinomycetota bacterium]|nr:hypothetical protein [Actinomycetota bacterium]